MAKGEGVVAYPTEGATQRWFYLVSGCFQPTAYDILVPYGSTERQVQQTVRNVWDLHGNRRVEVWRA